MEKTERIAGGMFIIVLMLFTLTPFNNDIQAVASAAGSSEAVKAIALVFPILWVGLIMTVAGFTGYEILSQMQ